MNDQAVMAADVGFRNRARVVHEAFDFFNSAVVVSHFDSVSPPSWEPHPGCISCTCV